MQGRGCYVDDVVLPEMAWCAFVRSPHAHAHIKSIATDAAAALPGVLLTLTAADWERAGHGELTIVHPMPFSDGRPMKTTSKSGISFARMAAAWTSTSGAFRPSSRPTRSTPRRRSA